MREFFGHYLGVILALVGLAIVLTVVVFRKRLFERGYHKGDAVNPRKVKRQNPADR